MRKALFAAVLCLALSAFGTVAWADTFITFDGVGDATVINTTYPGVTFSCFSSGLHCAGANSGDVYARNNVGFAFNDPNVVSTLQAGIPAQQDSVTGAIKVDFATPQSAVSIEDFLFTAPEGLGGPGYGYLQAYDSAFTLLGMVQDTTPGIYSLLSFSSPAGNISHLLIGDVGGGDNTISLFDNLCYSDSATGCGVGGGNNNGSVPEPGSILLLGTAASLIFWKFRKKLAR